MCDFIELIDTLRWYWRSGILRHAFEISVNLSNMEKQVMEKIAEKIVSRSRARRSRYCGSETLSNTLVEQR